MAHSHDRLLNWLLALLLATSCSQPPDNSIVGAGGNAGTNGLSTKLYRNQKVDKIDLLFAIDNSASMADKQAILAAAVPDLVGRLTNPVCVNRTSRAYINSPAPGQPCDDPATQEREFEPLNDIHIGVITSSIGGHGADQCSNLPTTNWNPTQEDMSHLITRKKAGGDVPTYESRGYLNWDPKGKDAPPGESNTASLNTNFTDIVGGVGETGCGFEASLESWYRFLVDPAPYIKMVACPCNDTDVNNSCRCGDGVDQTVLQQRADMIRQDSLLAIVMLTDENDCSLMDWGQNFLALQSLDGNGTFHLARGTDACLSNPWDANCKSCWEVDPNAYPECAAGWGSQADADRLDTINLRCFEQKRRFGISFLNPIKRYVDGLTQARFANNTINPIFCPRYATKPDPNDPNVVIADPETCEGNNGPLRDKSLVFIAGIVGVPWQDLARDPADLTRGYRTAKELNWTPAQYAADNQSPPAGLPQDATIWDVILGKTMPSTDAAHAYEPDPTLGPLDPLMQESVDPRSGANPITGDVLAPLSAGDPLANAINGSEWDIPGRNDLQYTCIFDLPQPIDCSKQEHAFGCDCQDAKQNPLCWNGSTYGTMQYRAKAYPGRRQLSVLKGAGDQAIVASICPKNVDPNATTANDWGYRPAIAAIVDRLKGALQGTCWDQELEPDAQGLVSCIVLEATKSTDVDQDGNVLCPPCDGVRKTPTSTAINALQADSTFAANALNCVCEISQVSDPALLASCIQSNPADPNAMGWCYVDSAKNANANADILASCPANQKRLIRFVGSNIPLAGSLTYLQCQPGAVGGLGTPVP